MRIASRPTCGTRAYRLRAGLRRAAHLALLAALAPAAARALVVNEDPELVQRSPAPGMGFEHVGKIRQTTGVYLGGGWVLTAGHVGAGELSLDGSKYDP